MENTKIAKQPPASGQQTQSSPNEAEFKPSAPPFGQMATINNLQRTIGNQAVMQLIRSQMASTEQVIQPKYEPGKSQSKSATILASDWYTDLEKYERKRVKEMLSKADKTIYTTWTEIKNQLIVDKDDLSNSLLKFMTTEADLKHATDHLKSRGKQLTMPLMRKLEEKAHEIGGGSVLVKTDLPQLPDTATAPNKNWNDKQNLRDETHKSFWPSTKDSVFAQSAFLGQDIEGENHLLCPGCGKLQKEGAMNKDHQHSWNDFRDQLIEIALQANLNPKSLKVLQKHYGGLFDHFFEEKHNIIYAKHELWNDYSNDLNNLLLLCSTCNSTDKKVADPQTWFTDAPYFGEPFIQYVGDLSTAFHVPQGGWGAKAREWLKLRMKQIQPLIDLDFNVHELRSHHSKAFNELSKAKASPKGVSTKKDAARKDNKRKAEGNMDLIDTGIKQIHHFNKYIDDHKGKFPAFEDNDSEDEFEKVNASKNKSTLDLRVSKKQKVDDPLMKMHYATPLNKQVPFFTLGPSLKEKDISTISALRKTLREKAILQAYGASDPYSKSLNSEEQDLYNKELTRQKKMWKDAQVHYKKNKEFPAEFAIVLESFPFEVSMKIHEFMWSVQPKK